MRILALDAWPIVLAAVLLFPLLTHTGHPLARDLVFTPRPPFTWETVGLGGEPPRAVPLDGLVWLGSSVVGGAVLARVLLVAVLLLAGWGAHRLIGSAPFAARLLLAGLAVWNPFTVERLALGQWALLFSYAAIWWLVPSAVAAVEHGGSRRVARAVVWSAVASITPTGGVVAIIVVLVAVLGRAARRRSLALVATVAALQLPWVLPSLVASSVRAADPAGLRAFAADGESAAGVLVSLLGLGGIWDGGSVPTSREGVLLPIVTAGLFVIGVMVLVRMRPGLEHGRDLAVLGVTGLVLAAMTSVPGLREVLTVLMSIPGVALLRDAQKWVLLLAPLALVAIAMILAVAARRVRAGWWPAVWVATAVLVPVLLLPDGASTVSSTVRPVEYPSDFATIRTTLEDGHSGAVAVLPWRSYRLFTWGRPVAVYDPASRWFDREVVRDDSLLVGDRYLSGESRRAALVGRVVDAGVVDDDAQRELVRQGIGWLLVYADDPAADDLELGGLVPAAGGEDVVLYSLGPAAETRPTATAIAVVVIGNAAAGLTVLGALVLAVRRRGRVVQRRT